MSSKRAAEVEVIRVLRAIRSLPADDRDRRTALLRDLGEATVSLREHFLTAGGEPDWAGRTGAYRAAITELYSDAGYSIDDAKATQKLARYHIANTLREYLSPSDIAAIGLRVETPRERQAELRDRQAAIVAAATATVPVDVPGTPVERVEAIRAALAALQSVRPLTADERAHEEYAETYRTARKLVEQVVAAARHIARTWPPPPGEEHIIA
jgi:hypothetical protein